MQRFWIIWLCVLSVLVFGVPANNAKYPVKLPDGSVLFLKTIGDENGYIEITEDGYTVLMGEDRFYYYALEENGNLVLSGIRVHPPESRTDEEKAFLHKLQPMLGMDIIERRIEKSQQMFRKSFTTNKGLTLRNYPEKTINKLLVILVDFPDLKGTESLDNMERVFEEKNYMGYGCVNDYFEEVSNGLFGITADVVGWYTASQQHDYYGKNQEKYYEHVRELVLEAIHQADADGVDFAQYDNDGNGYVDGLTIIHAGEGAEAGAKTNIWSHRGFFQEIQLDGVKLNNYTIQPEKQYGQRVNIGIICHEYGHVLGLPDMYDVSGKTRGIGYWGLMGYGSWGADFNSPYLPSHISAPLKIDLGWAQINQIEKDSAKVKIPAVEHSNQILVIPFPAQKGFYYIENRRKTGFDSRIPGEGILIWRKEGWKIDLIEADGRNDLEKNANNGDSGDPFPGDTQKHELTRYSNPPSIFSDSSYTGIDILNISSPSELMTLDIYRSIKEPILQVLNARNLYHVQADSGKISQVRIRITNTGDGVLKWHLRARKSKPIVIGPMAPSDYTLLERNEFKVEKWAGKGFAKQNTWVKNSDESVELKYDLSETMRVYMLGSTSLSEFYVATKFNIEEEDFQLDSVKVFVKTGLSPNAFQAQVCLSDPASGTPGKPIYSRMVDSKSIWGDWITIPVTDDIIFHSGETFWVRIKFPVDYLSPIGITGAGTKDAAGMNYYSFDGIRWNALGDVIHTGLEVDDDAFLIRAYGHMNSKTIISFQPDSGLLLPGDTAMINMLIDARNVSSKTYYYDLIFSTNQLFGEREQIYFTEINITGISSHPLNNGENNTIKDFEIRKIYPNPFNPVTFLSLKVNKPDRYSVILYNAIGQKVKTLLVNQSLSPGNYRFEIRANELTSGVYFLNIKNNHLFETRKIILLK